ncbi:MULTISPECIES: RNA polymerase sigma factor region1.1 domain-containing protein [unclassified Bradyrhizobium]|uniref:RNA polymerase sigma factor region1.1 domain-containing protein n=1 Tax=unclassified Bradyrhizobium TaxID=2631580 RepID=UPI00339785DF
MLKRREHERGGIIRRAIEIGERNGKITFDELNQLCDSSTLDPKDVERVLNALSEAGIWIEGD